MAAVSESPSDHPISVEQVIEQYETGGNAIWSAVSGSLSLLLSIYSQNPTPAFLVRTNIPEQLWHIALEVDQNDIAQNFLQNIERTSHELKAPLPDKLYTFSLCADSEVPWSKSHGETSVSDSGARFDGPAIPGQILCTVQDLGGTLLLRLTSGGDSPPSTTRFLNQIAHVTRQLLISAAIDELKLLDLDLVCELDRQDLLRWNQQAPLTVAATVHERIEQRAMESPESEAVQAWDGALSYLELDTLSSHLSSLLLEKGVQSGDCIPLCFEKSLWTVVAMLGVLKSGCSFLLMDITHPTSRLQTLSDEVKANLVLSSSTQRDRAIGLGPQVVVVSASSLSVVPAGNYKRHRPAVSPSDVAGIIFTSGTTGTPKGIQLEHQSMCSSLLALAELFGINEQTRYFQFSSYAFDAAFGEMLMTLMCGGCICIPSEGDRLNKLAESIRGFGANAVLLTPTVLRLLSPSDVPCLTTLISGGERVTQDIVSTWGKHLNFVIVYGPAETTVACIAKKAILAEDEAIRIGFPVNSRVWIALPDNPNRLAPIGVLGELVIESPGIARSYINNPSNSAQLFLDSPPWAGDWESSLLSMGRCYRTGDLAQYAENGEIIFVGRRDRQVKLRGQRIELEDIELKLQQHNRLPGAHIVLEVLDIQGTSNLVAFLQNPLIQINDGQQASGVITPTTEETQLEIEMIRAHISQELPAYMWPVVWIPLKELPLTPTGKLDRRMLQRLGKDYYTRLSTSHGDEESLSPAELTLARMWREVLQFATQSLTSDSHFFRLGGDSLRVMKLVAIASKNGYHLTMEKVLKNPTISEMAASMQDNPATSVDEATSRSSLAQDDLSYVYPLLEEHGLDQGQVEDILSCTPLQEGLFSLSLALPSLYSSQFVFELSAEVDIQRLKVAWSSAVDAFPILRTAIVPSSSGLVQVVLRPQADWTTIWDNLPHFLSMDKDTQFLAGQPLARQWHVRDPSSGQDHLVLTLHHAVFDGWSLDSVVSHVRKRYYEDAQFVREPGSFKEFVQFCRSIDKDGGRRFWREQLANAPTPSFPNLPLTGRLATDGACLQHTMTTPAVSNLSTTTTIMARASWALLLAEYEGSDDITFGNSLHGRNSLPLEMQDVVGPTITTLPIRVRLDRSQTVLSYLNSLQEQFSAMIPYEQFGLSQILSMDEDVKNAASFRTLLIVQIEDVQTRENERIRLVEVERSLHEYPLVLTLMPRKAQIEIVATFDSAIITAAQVHRILRQFEQTFNEISAATTDTRVGDLDLTSQADKATMFRWNTRSHTAFEVCVHELIQEQVKRSPDSPAIYAEHKSLDYAALDKFSDAIAGELARSGVGPGSVVGVLFEKSVWAPVSILAIIKAGSAFAPLSPTNPQARLEDIARDAGINVVLCSPLQERAFSNPAWQTIVVSDETVGSFRPVVMSQSRLVTPDSLLYFLSTSGTTGTPKVFAVQHKSFATGAIARAPLIMRNSDSRVLQFAPYVFDPSVEDILTTFMFGGCVCVPSDEDIMGDLSGFMRTARVNFANITPSVAHTLKQDDLPDFKTLLLSGESPDQALVDKWHGRARVMNGYGPSECSVKCSINCNLSRDDPRNIGHSAGTSLWVVKPANHNLLTPLGAVGELVIESPNLARGYLNRPAATEEKFITNPSWIGELRGGREARMYKTGDLVRCREDGSIVYIGRADLQLKLNGQRLEGEEVRQHIQQCLQDEQLHVFVDTARFEGQESDVLVAYLASKGENLLASALELDPKLQQRLVNLRGFVIQHLESLLPKYMIPSVFLAVTKIPVTANGKADRRALRARTQRQRLEPHLLLSAGKRIQTPITTKGEILLHGLWQKLLGLKSDEFGANAHFFELAGSSLMAIRLAAAVRDLGYNLSARQIFESPVLSEMAAEMVPLEKKIRTAELAQFSLLDKIGCNFDGLKASLAAHNIREEDVENAYPCTRQQKRYVEGERLAPGGTTYRHIVPLPADIDLVRLESALRRVVHANAFLRTRIVPLSSDVVQVVLKDDFNCRHVDKLASLVSEDQKVSWGFGHPQSRFGIVHGGDVEARYLTWSSCHVVFDGWCRKLLLDDIDYAYHHDNVPPSRPQFDMFIEHVYSLEMDAIDNKLIQKLENQQFWTNFTLADTYVPRLTHFLSLGVDFPATLPAGMSYPSVLLTAWAIVARHVENYDRFLFNLLLGGRDAAFTGIDGLMGPTNTTAPLATCIESHSSVRWNVQLMHKQIGEVGRIQHTVQLGERLHRLLAYAPVLMVHPPEDYVESPTKHLGLVRSRAEMVHGVADAMGMSFCLRTNNTGVDLVLGVDTTLFPADKAVRYLSYFEQILMRIFGPGGLDLTVAELDLASMSPTSSVSISTDLMS